MRLRAFIAGALLWSAAAGAVLPDEQLADPALEARARALSTQLRCVVCQNQTIDDSDAPLARDLRLIVREQLKAGASDKQVIDFVVARYGNFVLLKPPFEPTTWLLWLGPFLVVLLGGIGVAVYISGRTRPQGPAGLTPEERARIESLLRDPDQA